MIDLSFDNGTVEQYTLILTTRDQNKLGQLANVRNVKYSAKLNGADELSFEVCKQLDDHEEVLWDDIYDLRLVYIKELNQYFEIRVDLVDKVYMTKIITCTALCECELSQTGLHDIEINTAEDIARPDYDVNYPTVFYRILPSDPTSDDYKKKRNSSLLHRILDKVPAYTIKHVDSSLSNLQRSFSISDTTVYDFLTGECAEQFNCLFQFDSSDRSISVYDLYTVCNTCGHRGDFNDVCPECGGTDLKYFGEDTTVFVSTENLTEEVRFETDTDSIKNTFRLEAGDDNMTAAVININPTGSRYIYEFSDEARKDMPTELVSKMDQYDEDYNYYNNEYEISIDNESIVTNFNNLANKYSQMTCQNCGYRGNFTDLCPECGSTNIVQKTWPTIPAKILGYKNLMPYYYECIDFYSYLKHSMMPQVVISGTTVNTEVQKVQTAFTDPNFYLALSKVSENTSLASVNTAAVNWAKTIIRSGYVKISVDTNSTNSFLYGGQATYTYNGQSIVYHYGTWTGRFKITNVADEKDYAYCPTSGNTFSVTVNDKYEKFIEEKIVKQILSKCNEEVYDVIKLIADRNTTKFQEVIRLYSANRLQSFHDAIEAAVGILIDSGQGSSGKTVCGNCGFTGYYNLQCPSCGSKNIIKSGAPKSMLYEDFYTPFYDMLQICEEELNLRNNEIDKIWGSYDMNGYVVADGIIQFLVTEVKSIHDLLNFQNYIGDDLYKIFTTYIREQTYTNSNYISDGLDDNELFANADRFIGRAKEELHKAATYQHSIKSNLNNLLSIKEFKPLLKKFELGNWIRIKADDKVYRLRLIAYSIDFNSLQTINTEFSDITITANGFNDIQSILQQASSMSSTYGYTEKQAETGANIQYNYIDKWVQDGLNSSLVRINNNNDEDIRIDEAGITARTYDDISETYDGEQMRITHNVIAFTDDNWESVKTALGKFRMEHHTIDVEDEFGGINTNISNKAIYDDYGLVANAVLAGWIVGSYMEGSTIIGSHFQNPGNSSYIDMTSSTANGRNYFIKCSNGTEDKFTVDKNGNVDIRGATFAGTNLVLGGTNNTQGTLKVLDSTNNQQKPIVEMNNEGIRIYNGLIQDAMGYNFWDLNSGEFRMAANSKVYDPNANFSKPYVPTNSNFPASDWTTEELKKANVGKTFLNTSTNKTYIYKCLLPTLESSHPYTNGIDEYTILNVPSSWNTAYLTFDSDCKTESGWDYLYFYKTTSNGTYKATLNGDSFASKTLAIDVSVNHKIHMHWHTDSSNVFYGYKFTVTDSGTDTLNTTWSSTSLPGGSWTTTTLTPSYEWVEATIEEYINGKVSSSSEEINLTQEQVFDILTNGRQDQGLYLNNGRVYINMQYLSTNAITIGGSQYQGDYYLNILDENDNPIGKWDKNGIEANAGTFGKLRVFNDNNTTYLKYVTDAKRQYVNQTWSAGRITDDNRIIRFIVNPYKEGWQTDGEISINFKMSIRNVSSYKTATQCTIYVYKYTSSTRQRVLTAMVKYDGTGTNINTIEVFDEETQEWVAWSTLNYTFEHNFGANDGEAYYIQCIVEKRNANYTNNGPTSLIIDDDGKGSSFVVREGTNHKAICTGDFLGSFKGDATLDTLKIGDHIISGDGNFITSTDNMGSYISYDGIRVWSGAGDFGDSNDILQLFYYDISREEGGTPYGLSWQTSDERAKEEIEDLDSGLSKRFIDSIRTRKFKYKGAEGKHYGVIAQETRVVLDELGEEDSKLEYIMGRPDGKIPNQRSVHYEEFVPHLINYVKDLRSEIDDLKAEIKELKDE